MLQPSDHILSWRIWNMWRMWMGGWSGSACWSRLRGWGQRHEPERRAAEMARLS